MELSNLIPIAAILAGAVVVVFVLRYFMHRRGPLPAPTPPSPVTPPSAPAPLTAVEEEYLDSSHIITRPADPRDASR